MPRRLIVAVMMIAVVAGVSRVDLASPVAAQPASPVAGTPAATADADLLRRLVRERLQALVDADLDQADELFAPEYQHISSSGALRTREEHLERIRTGVHDYRVLEPASAIDVRLYGEVAVVTYQSRVDLLSDGNHLTGRGWHTEVFERRDGRWLLVWSQTTPVQE